MCATYRYHGLISKADAVELLWEKKDGTFLVRKSVAGKFILSFKLVHLNNSLFFVTLTISFLESKEYYL